ncbi:hypothetical protein HDV05_001511 [Chytridiales sp. JEL 0842]|nr:hypothetical protein HDV05_001511 [Chytridiales sp. JEL 0842]
MTAAVCTLTLLNSAIIVPSNTKYPSGGSIQIQVSSSCQPGGVSVTGPFAKDSNELKPVVSIDPYLASVTLQDGTECERGSTDGVCKYLPDLNLVYRSANSDSDQVVLDSDYNFGSEEDVKSDEERRTDTPTNAKSPAAPEEFVGSKRDLYHLVGMVCNFKSPAQQVQDKSITMPITTESPDSVLQRKSIEKPLRASKDSGELNPIKLTSGFKSLSRRVSSIFKRPGTPSAARTPEPIAESPSKSSISHVSPSVEDKFTNAIIDKPMDKPTSSIKESKPAEPKPTLVRKLSKRLSKLFKHIKSPEDELPSDSDNLPPAPKLKKTFTMDTITRWKKSRRVFFNMEKNTEIPPADGSGGLKKKLSLLELFGLYGAEPVSVSEEQDSGTGDSGDEVQKGSVEVFGGDNEEDGHVVDEEGALTLTTSKMDPQSSTSTAPTVQFMQQTTPIPAKEQEETIAQDSARPPSSLEKAMDKVGRTLRRFSSSFIRSNSDLTPLISPELISSNNDNGLVEGAIAPAAEVERSIEDVEDIVETERVAYLDLNNLVAPIQDFDERSSLPPVTLRSLPQWESVDSEEVGPGVFFVSSSKKPKVTEGTPKVEHVDVPKIMQLFVDYSKLIPPNADFDEASAIPPLILRPLKSWSSAEFEEIGPCVFLA